MLALAHVAPCKSDGSAGVRKTFPVPGRCVRCRDSVGGQHRHRRSSFRPVLIVSMHTARHTGSKNIPVSAALLWLRKEAVIPRRRIACKTISNFLGNVPWPSDSCASGQIADQLKANARCLERALARRDITVLAGSRLSPADAFS